MMLALVKDFNCSGAELSDQQQLQLIRQPYIFLTILCQAAGLYDGYGNFNMKVTVGDEAMVIIGCVFIKLSNICSNNIYLFMYLIGILRYLKGV